MRHLIAIIFLGLLSLNAQSSSKETATSSQIKSSEITLAMQIRHNYEQFIDTKPSKKKRQLAHQVRSNIETFEATYPNASMMPETLTLLKEVDIYLDSQH